MKIKSVSKEFGAVCTPDFFGYNVDDELQYRGRLAKMNDLKNLKTVVMICLMRN